jgi:hypothetical protein
MASKKFYGYYTKGNKIALIEKDVSTSGSDLNAEDYGKYKSPKTNVADGLELEYTYSPTYRLNTTYTYDSDVVKFIGWGSDGTNLLLFTYGHNAETHKDLSTIFSANDWVYIQTGRWAGLHQVKSTGSANGILTLKTLAHITPSLVTCDIDLTTGEALTGNDADAILKLEQFKDDTSSLDTKYIYIINSANTAKNDGFFTVTHGTAGTGDMTLTTKHYLNSDRDYTTAVADNGAVSDDTVTIYNVFYETTDVLKNITIMEDESFELDLPPYLCKAVVYYLKAKDAEFKGEIDLFRYNITEFKRMMEKHKSAKEFGPKLIQGFWGMR